MLAYLFILLTLLWRLAPQSIFPHPHNFTPELAALLFFGVTVNRKRWWIPVLLLAGADFILNRHYGYPFTLDLPITWVWYGVMLWFGSLLKENLKPMRVGAVAVAGSVSFFLVSNFAVWAMWNMYPKTLSGLTACYVAGIPFYRPMLAGDVLFTAVIFGIPMLVKARAPQDSHRRMAI